MDPFNQFNHIRRLLDSLRPALEQYECIQGSMQRVMLQRQNGQWTLVELSGFRLPR